VVKYQGSRLDHELRAIESSSTNQTEDYDIYVYQTDEDGRRKVIIFGYFKAI
jgi:hypothetical protein